MLIKLETIMWMLNKKLLENEVKCEGVAACEARRQTEREKCVKWNEWAVV